MVRIVLVDDHHLVRLAIKQLLSTSNEIEVVGEAANGEEAIELVQEVQPDIVLMDLNMPGIDGLEASYQLLRQQQHLKIIVLTAVNKKLFFYALMRAGVAGYLTKNTNIEELLTAINIVRQGGRYIASALAQELALYQPPTALPLDVLSERELQVFLMIMQGHHKVKSIAERLRLSSKTINTYRYNIFNKLNVKNDVELTHLALHHGLLDQRDEFEPIGSDTIPLSSR